MINKELIDSSWTPDHYMIYLYLSVANADYNLSDDELEALHSKFDDREEALDRNYSTIIMDVMKEYKQHSDFEMNEFIMDYSDKFCSDQETKVKIMADLKDIIEADGIVKDVETLMFRNIKRMLG
ncbi:MAG: TerB family tellurite resistance protein [Bacteroidia bacterium]|nr:TerB family tellurite resistance protein [Bacteroidia bacterium]